MAKIDTKRKLLDLKHEHCLKKSADNSGLMLLINVTQNTSVARINKNEREVADRGQWLYNRSIFTITQIRATMIVSDYLTEINYYIVYHHLHK